MITNNVTNNQPAFTSTIRMSHKTAKALNEQSKYVKEALCEDLKSLRNNGRDDIVNISFKQRISKSIMPIFGQICEEKVLGMELFEKRGADYYFSKANKTVNSFNDEFYGKLGVMDLYRTARKKIKPIDTVSNKFMQYV